MFHLIALGTRISPFKTTRAKINSMTKQHTILGIEITPTAENKTTDEAISVAQCLEKETTEKGALFYIFLKHFVGLVTFCGTSSIVVSRQSMLNPSSSFPVCNTFLNIQLKACFLPAQYERFLSKSMPKNKTDQSAPFAGCSHKQTDIFSGNHGASSHFARRQICFTRSLRLFSEAMPRIPRPDYFQWVTVV